MTPDQKSPDEAKQAQQAALAAVHGSVPNGFRLLKSFETFCVGDIVADCEGKWRGPIPPDSDMIDREIRGYLCSSVDGCLPPVRAAARRFAPNDKISDGSEPFAGVTGSAARTEANMNKPNETPKDRLGEYLVGDLGPARRLLRMIRNNSMSPVPSALRDIEASIERCVSRIERDLGYPGAFPWPSENDLVPVEQWSVKTKTPTALINAQCPCCGKRPETLDPLPPGWCWDTMEPTNSGVWCPKWNEGLKPPNDKLSDGSEPFAGVTG